jgi:hypothetical protein
MMIRFKDFIKEDTDLIAQIRKIRGEMTAIRLKRELEKQKDALQTMRKERKKSGISNEYR